MYNFSFLICTYRLGWPSDVQEQCSTNSTWASAGLASLPAFWRLGQSIRRYIDSDGLGIHMLNAGKYTASILYNVTYFNWRIYSGSAYDRRFALWVVFAIVNSCYTSSWDILMDWSLLKRNSKHWLLRDELGFKDNVPFYYWAVISNVLLRFSWVSISILSLDLL